MSLTVRTLPVALCTVMLVAVPARAQEPPGTAITQQTGAVAGRATWRATGAALVGAHVAVAGMRLQTLTQAGGRYVLTGVPVGAQRVELAVGDYGTVMRSVVIAAGDTTAVDFALLPAAVEPDLLIRSAAGGPVPRREIGNSIAVLTASDLQSSSAATLTEALQGRVPGLLVLGGSGLAGAGHQLMMRGPGSWLWSDRPLVFVDGVRVADMPYPSVTGVSQTADPLDAIDPEMVQQVEVLRGPAAGMVDGQVTSVGAIEVFTKRGMLGGPRWSFATDQGAQWLGHVGPGGATNATGLGLNDCSAAPGCPAGGSWLRNGREQRYRASVSGGSSGFLAGYFVSGDWSREEGVIAPQRAGGWGLRGNLDLRPLGSLHVHVRSTYARGVTRWIPDNAFLMSVLTASQVGLTVGPDSLLAEGLYQHSNAAGVTTTVAWAPTGSLRQRLRVGSEWAGSPYDVAFPFGVRFSSEGDTRIRTRTLDYTGAWRLALGGGVRSRVSWGARLFDQTFAETVRYNDLIGHSVPEFAGVSGTSTVTVGSATVSARRFFVQDRLSLGEALYVTGGVRWDDASLADTIGPQPFPAAQVSYVVSRHSFWPRWWEVLQLRFAIGSGGRPERATVSTGPFVIAPPAFLPPSVRAERAREIEAGLESSMFGGRLSLEYTYYSQRTSDVMADVFSQTAAGLFTLPANVGAITNHGQEVAVSVTAVRRPGLTWDIGGQWSTNHNEAEDINPRIYGTQELVSGEPVGSYYGSVVVNGSDVGVAPSTTWQMIGPPYPTVAYGLTTGLTIGDRLELAALAEGQGGQYLESSTAWWSNVYGTWPGCIAIQDSMQAGDLSGLTAEQRAVCDPYSVADMGPWTWPAGFFRLRTVSLAYRLPERWLGAHRRAWIRVTARNLLLITDYPGLDPEAINGASTDPAPVAAVRQEMAQLPLPKSVALSLKLEL